MDSGLPWGKFVVLSILVVILNLAILAGGIAVAVWTLRALGVGI